MYLQSDFSFSYKHTLRFLLIHKCGYFFNSFELPKLNYTYLFFTLNDIVDLDDVSSFNYFYLIKFFFGKKSYFTNTTSIFHLGVTYYYFKVFCFFFKNSKFYTLAFFSNDLLPLSSSFHVKQSIIDLHKGLFIFKFFDLNLFLEKKTNVGLYNLNHNLNLKFKFSCIDINSSIYFFDFFKIY